MSPEPTNTYTIAVTFTGLASLVAGKISGGKCFVRNRNTREVKYYNATAKSATTANLPVDSKNFTTAWETGHVIEIGMMGEEFGTVTHTVDTSKGGGRLTLAVTAASTTTHPNVTL